ncbi:hypothetical protein PILCRDRAFT_812075 [Piloderma croceum F 1598]|uniref:Protein kinase domain-containing protein n=1 Tax=Piloderma croceum (strain F 1598) TaxID=765440 RepID=A0A0C3GF79_PILCF|nr:hypothetical protein PILCRDRAFT_812075 [Piloderma croceum F 1598]
MDVSLKHLYTRPLMKLSRTSGLYPECMTLKQVEWVGNSVIDGGGYGDIRKGLLNGQEIAVKILRVFRKSDKDSLLKEFCSEAVLWHQLNHSNVLPFYGVFRLPDDRLCLTSPWMNNGNVVHFLKSYPETKCVPLIIDIAEGLDYLHTSRPRIIHGDIKGVNILITPSRRACLADFGLATTKDSLYPVTSAASRNGTMRWLAPELLDPDINDASCVNTLASDVFAYACVCYEIFSGQLPLNEIIHDYRIIISVRKGGRPLRPSDDRSRIRGLDNEIWTIVQTCWAQDPKCRPTAHQIV